MTKVTCLESGYDFITLYFETTQDTVLAAKRLYNYLVRVNFDHLDLQRKNLTHKPGDVPHFHNGIDATKGPHSHIIYPHRPTEQDWDTLKTILQHKLVQIELGTSLSYEEIS